jgi:hypothetical protein
VNDEPSMTIPDETMSIREILHRHVRGLPIEGKDPKTAIWDEESNGINPKTLDLTEIQQYKEDAQKSYEKLVKKQTKRKAIQLDLEEEQPEGQ